ncbi:MAG: acetyl-CoA carboxylase biotin carboxyl carrier protein subunit [Clostridia bacterium]|nr:acetyl-CoA carboxylase biotin carboxyl carrier protein subunit [Clostridia bacterium]
MKYRVTLNDKEYEVEVEKVEHNIVDEDDRMAPVAAPVAAPAQAPAAPAAAPAASVNASASAVKAPLPGIVVAVKAQVGQAVKAGEAVVVIEAMKMENEIVAPTAGTVKAIFVQKGASVQTDAPLFEIA